MALSLEEKEAELVATNKAVPTHEQFANVDEYAESFRLGKGPNIHKMRLEIKREELEQLKSS
ncbi:MAG TPA: hypothetical protein VJJ55_01195 [Candidatus Paceibacterota bacterium]